MLSSLQKEHGIVCPAILVIVIRQKFRYCPSLTKKKKGIHLVCLVYWTSRKNTLELWFGFPPVVTLLQEEQFRTDRAIQYK